MIKGYLNNRCPYKQLIGRGLLFRLPIIPAKDCENAYIPVLHLSGWMIEDGEHKFFIDLSWVKVAKVYTPGRTLRILTSDQGNRTAIFRRHFGMSITQYSGSNFRRNGLGKISIEKFTEHIDGERGIVNLFSYGSNMELFRENTYELNEAETKIISYKF